MWNKKPINTFQNDVAPGTINSLRQLTQTQYVNINSKYRQGAILSTSTDFQIQLPETINRVSEMELVHIEIPAYAYFMFSSVKRNNVFWVTPVDTTDRLMITIPDGNYTPPELVDYLNLTYFYQNTSSSNPFSNIEFAFDPINFKCSFVYADPTIQPVFFEVSFFDLMLNIDFISSFGWQMGFMSPLYSGYTNITGEMPANICTQRVLYLSVNDFQYNNNSNHLVVLKNSSCLNDFLLGKIVLPGVTFFNVYSNYAAPQMLSFSRKYNGPVDLKKLEIKVYDEDGTIITLNGLDFSFTLKLTCVYETI